MNKIRKMHFRKISSTLTAHHYQRYSISCRTLFIVVIRRSVWDNIIACVTVSNRFSCFKVFTTEPGKVKQIKRLTTDFDI